MTWQQIIAAYTNNKRIDDLRADFNAWRAEMQRELRDLRTEMKEGFRKLEERFEHPITRP